MIVYAFGSREVTDRDLVYRTLDRLVPRNTTALWSGGARGADTLAVEWCHDHQHNPIVSVTWPADWARFGRSAGARRNAELIKALPANSLCICFAPPRAHVGGSLSPGSADAVRKCLARNLSITIVFGNGTHVHLSGTPSHDSTKAIVAGGPIPRCPNKCHDMARDSVPHGGTSCDENEASLSNMKQNC